MKKKGRQLKILITAGPTREYLDPVRFISNASSGTIGYLLAEQAAKRRHKIVLLSGPTCLRRPAKVKCVTFESARQLKAEVDRYFNWADCVIAAAAVGDFRPNNISRQKLKKNRNNLTLKLVKNPDILKALGEKNRGKNKALVGFALETNSLYRNARLKLKSKYLDFIVATKLSSKQLPFGDRPINGAIISRSCIDKFRRMSKTRLARIILDRVENLCYIL
ncbi:MAG: phosphopantothenoylcysteine decarboxylase [Candidatus Omnitrophica bacterium]|nr:phosphopantothenoylcysteine decarboxylase [Candidatus Omnitrophota bacterium]MBU1925163.1 phosphopantothenoylcysteine decarboxylase [Candidatus Omnitrophota bacterium]